MTQTLYMRIVLDYENPSDALTKGIAIQKTFEEVLRRKCIPVKKVHMDGFGNSEKEA